MAIEASDQLMDCYHADLARREIEVLLNRGDGDADLLMAALKAAGNASSVGKAARIMEAALERALTVGFV
jgi:hypothetical protein